MDAGKMSTPEASVILGAAVIDDVMGLFVLAFLAASCSTTDAGAFGVAPMLSDLLQRHVPWAAKHPLTVQMTFISICVTVFFLVAYGAAKRWSDPLIRQLRRLDVNEAVASCVLALVLLYAISAEWLGSVAGITGAYLLGYVFVDSKLKSYIERTFAALGHSLLIPLFFVSIGLSSNFRALGGHWLLLAVIFAVAVVTKLVGCGSAALVMGMGPVRSLRVRLRHDFQGRGWPDCDGDGGQYGHLQRVRGCGHGHGGAVDDAVYAADHAWSLPDEMRTGLGRGATGRQRRLGV